MPTRGSNEAPHLLRLVALLAAGPRTAADATRQPGVRRRMPVARRSRMAGTTPTGDRERDDRPACLTPAPPTPYRRCKRLQKGERCRPR